MCWKQWLNSKVFHLSPNPLTLTLVLLNIQKYQSKSVKGVRRSYPILPKINTINPKSNLVTPISMINL